MKKLLQKLFRKPVLRLADKYSSRPDKQRVFDSLTELHKKILSGNEKKGLIIPLHTATKRSLYFQISIKAQKTKQMILQYVKRIMLLRLTIIFNAGFFFINLGDGEELWENTIFAVKKNNKPSFEKEKLFQQQKRFIKIFGNHDLYWANDPWHGRNWKAFMEKRYLYMKAVFLPQLLMNVRFKFI
jgi:hypothetical protein